MVLNWPKKYTGSARFSQFALCIQQYVLDYQSSADIFTCIILERGGGGVGRAHV